MLVAEAIVQELLVSLMELRMKEKETLVMDEVESVEIMRQLHVHLQKDEELVRGLVVCVSFIVSECRLTGVVWVENRFATRFVSERAMNSSWKNCN